MQSWHALITKKITLINVFRYKANCTLAKGKSHYASDFLGPQNLWKECEENTVPWQIHLYRSPTEAIKSILLFRKGHSSVNSLEWWATTIYMTIPNIILILEKINHKDENFKKVSMRKTEDSSGLYFKFSLNGIIFFNKLHSTIPMQIEISRGQVELKDLTMVFNTDNFFANTSYEQKISQRLIVAIKRW